MNQAQNCILIVEDEEDIAELLRFHLEKEGYAVELATTGEDGLEMAQSNPPALVLLDLMLPQVDGIEICRQLRQDSRTQLVPVVMLTAKGEETDVVAGLEAGADDYVVKPFSPKVVLARVSAVLRRQQFKTKQEPTSVKIHGLTIQPGLRKAILNEKALDLTESEFRILWLLARKPGWVFTRGQIVKGIRGQNYSVTDRAVDVQIVSLRRKLESPLIETVRGVGYRFKEV